MQAMQSCSIETTDRRHIRVLVVADPASMRQLLPTVLDADGDIEVVGTAPNPLDARQMIKDLNPDVVILDLDKPRMDGLSSFEKTMTPRPVPIVVVSSLTERAAEAALRALDCSSADFVTKPAGKVNDCVATLKSELVPKVKAAAETRVTRAVGHPSQPLQSGRIGTKIGIQLIAIGASTGGVAALQVVLAELRSTSPAVVIVQHMPPVFTRSFASRLDQITALNVVEAVDSEPILPGHAYVAPGGRHLEVMPSRKGFKCHVHDGPINSGHRPSVDLLFQSVAKHAGARSIGVILTGMGRDGAEGLLAMRDRGAMTFGQHQDSCVVYGMPRAAREIDAVVAELPPDEIGKIIGSASNGFKF